MEGMYKPKRLRTALIIATHDIMRLRRCAFARTGLAKSHVRAANLALATSTKAMWRRHHFDEWEQVLTEQLRVLGTQRFDDANDLLLSSSLRQSGSRKSGHDLGENSPVKTAGILTSDHLGSTRAIPREQG